MVVAMTCNHDHNHRDPKTLAIFGALTEHLNPFLRATDIDHQGLPQYVIRELHKFLECGVPEFGFSRWQCDGCTTGLVLPHSCKGRGFCPSCGGRRMSQTAANIIDQVIPLVPIRQWVISLPIPIRYLMAQDYKVLDHINRIINTVISSFYKKKGKSAGAKKPMTGAITFIQRAGGSINLNPHFHLAVMEGVFDAENKKDPRFVAVPKPTNDEVSGVLKKSAVRSWHSWSNHNA